MHDISTLFDRLSISAKAGDADHLRTLLWSQPEVLRSYLHSFALEHSPKSLIIDYVNDALARFIRTLEYVPLPVGPRILEIGSNPYLFHILLTRIFRESRITGTNFFDYNIFSSGVGNVSQTITSVEYNESYTFDSTLVNIETITELPFPAEYFDVIFFCETLEHLVVDPLSVFAKLHRVLRPTGHLIITLPNAVRLTNVALMLDGYNFFDIFSVNGVHGRHNREYTLDEIIRLLTENRFAVQRADTHDRFDYDLIDMWTADYTGRSVKLGRRKRDVLATLAAAGAELNNRGDNLYVVAKRT